jgi:hypothetical protein
MVGNGFSEYVIGQLMKEIIRVVERRLFPRALAIQPERMAA